MILGYIFENVLGFTLVLALFVLRHRTRSQRASNEKLQRYIRVATQGCRSFHDCASFFTFSIQLACIVVLARLDFGISASGMGDSTAKITWAISLLTMLPLLYVAFNPDLLREPSAHTYGDEKFRRRIDRKEQLRFLLFALCWLLFMYPFFSRMMETFGPSAIGGISGHGQAISTSDWDAVQSICVANVQPITQREIVAMKVFSVTGSLFVCLLALCKILWLAVKRQHGRSRLVHYIRGRWLKGRSHESQLSIAMFIAIPIIAVSQLWTMFRLRTFQEQVSQSSGTQDSDGQWTFGQIAAVTIFVPVLVECWFTWLYE